MPGIAMVGAAAPEPNCITGADDGVCGLLVDALLKLKLGVEAAEKLNAGLLSLD